MAVDVGRAGSSVRGARRRVSGFLWRRSWLKGSGLLLPPLGWIGVVYLAALVTLLLSGFSLGRLVHRADQGRLDALELQGDPQPRRHDLPADRVAHDLDRRRRHRHGRRDRLSYRVLHGPGRVLAHAGRAVRHGAAAALVELHRPRLRLARDPERGRRAELVAEPARTAGRGHRLHGHRDVARLLVPVAAVHDPAAVRGARARPGELPGGLARHGRAGSGRSGASSCRSRCPGSSRARSSPSRSRSATT